MAVNISNTKYYKKGEKLPDGTIAKRNIVWNTKNNRRVTGTVTVTTAAGVASKRYKGGRSVTALKRAEAKKKASSGSSRTTTTTGKNPPPSMSAAEKARALRLKQNKGVKAGTVRTGAKGQTVRKYNAKTGRWEVMASSGSAVARAQAQARAQVAGSAGKTKWQTAVETALKNRRGPAAVSSTSNRYQSGSGRGGGGGGSYTGLPPRSIWSVKGIAEQLSKGANVTATQISKNANITMNEAKTILAQAQRTLIEGR